MRIKPALALAAAFATAGCASIISGTTQEMSFHSTPEGATVTVDGNTLGVTPLTYPLKKSAHHVLTFTLDGYKPLILPLDSRLDGWFWGNIVFGGLVGSTTDGVSGAAHEYSPGQFIVSMEPLQASHLESETSKTAQQKAREFIVIGYRSIVADLHRGEGEYSRSLMEVLKIKPEGQPEAVKKLRSLSDVYTDIPDFADRAIELYLKDAPAKPSAAVIPPPPDPQNDRCKPGEIFEYGSCYPMKPLLGNKK